MDPIHSVPRYKDCLIHHLQIASIVNNSLRIPSDCVESLFPIQVQISMVLGTMVNQMIDDSWIVLCCLYNWRAENC